MKETMLLFLFIVLIPAAACAQEKTLYDVSEDMLFLTEAYAACADRDSACTREDVQSLKAGAKEGLRDFVKLVQSGNRSRMMLTPDQARALSVRAGQVREQLVHIEIADESCNAAVYFFTRLIDGFKTLMIYLNPIYLYIYIGLEIGGPLQYLCEFIGYFIYTVWSLLVTILLSPSCLFGWL